MANSGSGLGPGRPHVSSFLVLVAENDPEIARAARHSLKGSGYGVLATRDGVAALELASSEALALILLDIQLPGLDGLTVCGRVRAFSDVPIVMIAAHQADVVPALNAGADDCLCKPFAMDELLARVQAVLRRAHPATSQPSAIYACGELAVDFTSHRVSLAGRAVHLTPTEYRLLVALAHHPGLVLTHQQLLERAWGPEYGQDPNLLHVNVRRLRRKIEPDPEHPRYLLARHGVGYFVPKPG